MIENVSRRDFLKTMALGTGGLVLGVGLPGTATGDESGGGVQLAPSVFVAIATDGAVRIVAHRSEMGTGIRTSLPMVVADELEADWGRVEVVQADGDKRYGSQNTDGSRSIVQFFDTMRLAGATARTLLEQAAAARWRVPVAECTAREHHVLHAKSKNKLGFGDLVGAAAKLPVPAPASVRLKKPAEWRYVGKGVTSADTAAIVTGKATFGLDVRLDGMRHAVVARCPVLGGRVKSVDATAALAVKGVERVERLPAFKAPHAFQALGGVAVIAGSTHAAIQGRRALKIVWDEGPNATYDSKAFADEMAATARKPGTVLRARGDVDAALKAAESTHEAEYSLPHLAHASLEPPCAVARVTGGTCEAWAPTQNPQAAQQAVAAALGLKPEHVTIHVTLLGGGFGRKSKPDFIVEAALLAKAVGAPVKVTWTREDDLRHDYYHACAAQYCKAGLDAKGRPTAWLQRSVFPPIASTFNTQATHGAAFETGMGLADQPWDIPNLRYENGAAGAHVRIGWLRSVTNIWHAFASGSFVDELAARAKADPLTYLLALIGKPRQLDLAADGVKQPFNYGQPTTKYPYDTGRLANVARLVAGKAGWGGQLPRGRGRGIAVHCSFLSYVGVVVEVDVSRRGELRIPRVDIAIDCGQVIDPDRVRAQMEGSAVFGTSLAVLGQITATHGRIKEGNFHQYRLAYALDAPRQIHVHRVASEAPPSGVGEPGVPPFAPALANAIFAATGKRIRKLPIAAHDLSWD